MRLVSAKNVSRRGDIICHFDVMAKSSKLKDNNIQQMKASQAQRRNVMNVQSMHDWTSLKVGQTGKREVRAEHLNLGKSLPNLADKLLELTCAALTWS